MIRFTVLLAIALAGTAPAALVAADSGAFAKQACPPGKECPALQDTAAAAASAAARAGVADANRDMAAGVQAELSEADRRYAEAVARREAQIAEDRAAYEARVAAQQAEALRREREYAAAMADWQRRRDACLAGDFSQCANSNEAPQR